MKWTWPERPNRPDGVPVAWGSDPDARRVLIVPYADHLKVGDRVTVSAEGEWVVVSVDPVRLERP